MADYITLIGSEQVANAGRAISGAAQDMQRAASEIEDSLRRHREFLDDWLSRLMDAIDKVGAAR